MVKLGRQKRNRVTRVVRPLLRSKHCCLTRCNVGQVAPIAILPDDALLAIFDLYVKAPDDLPLASKEKLEAWQTLVHVCRRWRNLVFESPRRLNLRLVCTYRTHVKNTLDVWPALPLCIYGFNNCPAKNVDDIVAALGHSDRIRQVVIRHLGRRGLMEVWAAMGVPFPELTDLRLRALGEWTPTVPNLFLGGSAPLLRNLELESFPFPGLPKLLLSATNLVTLRLLYIPKSGYFSPKAMATCLSVLTGLRELVIIFKFNYPHAKIRHLSPLNRFVLPALTDFEFSGVAQYLEDLVVHIDSPRLNNLKITFSHQNHFETPQLFQFMNRTPRLEAPDKAILTFQSPVFRIIMSSQRSDKVTVDIRNARSFSTRNSDQQVLALADVCTSAFPLLSTVENLRFNDHVLAPAEWEDNIESAPWLELLRPFTAVKSLYLSERCEPRVSLALQELVEGRMMEVLPNLENLFLWDLRPSGPFHEGIVQFVAVRQLTHPILVFRWEGRFEPGPYSLW